MDGADWLILATIVVLIVFSGFFAAAETALTRVNRVKAITLDEEGRRGAAALTRLIEHPERFLNSVLFLLLLCQLVAATLVGVLGERLFAALGVAVATALEVMVIFVFAEAAPKTWAIQHSERAALFAARPVAAIVRFPPLRLLTTGLIGLANALLPGKGLKQGPFLSEEELLAMADVAVEEEVIEQEERALIHSIIEFGDTVVREVMVPRPDMVNVEDLIEELVGEIVDEYDVEDPAFEPLPDGDVRVNGRMPIDEVNELLHAELPEGDWDTIAGFVFNLLGHVPTEGETVDYNGHR